MPRSAFLPFGEYPSPEVLKTLFVFKDSIGDVIDLRDLVQKETEAFPIYRGIAILSIFFCAIGVHAVLQFAGKRVERGVDDVDGFVERITQRGEALSFLRGQSQILHDVLYSSSGCYADLIGIHLSQKIRLSSDRRYFFAASLPSSIRASLRRDLRDRTGKFGLFQISETAGLPHDRFKLLFSAMQVGTRSTAGVATAAEEGGFPCLNRLVQRLLVHPGHHENFPGGGVLYDGGDQTVGVELQGLCELRVHRPPFRRMRSTLSIRPRRYSAPPSSGRS